MRYCPFLYHTSTISISLPQIETWGLTSVPSTTRPYLLHSFICVQASTLLPKDWPSAYQTSDSATLFCHADRTKYTSPTLETGKAWTSAERVGGILKALSIAVLRTASFFDTVKNILSALRHHIFEHYRQFHIKSAQATLRS